MKLRIRYKSITKILDLQGETDFAIRHVKQRIKEELLAELQLTPLDSFELTLDGKSSLGSDSEELKRVGVVHGDLIKLILHAEALQEENRVPDQDESIIETEKSISELAFRDEEIKPTTSTKESVRIVRIGNSRQVRQLPHIEKQVGPLFLQDYRDGQTLPSALHTLYELPAVKDYFHAICAVLHNLMLESGFFPLFTRNMEHCLDITDVLSSVIVSLEYSHPAAETLAFCLNCNVLGPYVLVNGFVRSCVNTEEQVLSLQIKAEEFVKKFASDSKPVDETVIYRNLSKLSRIFKETIAYRALDIMREELNLLPLRGILSLFPEILIRIFSNLDACSLCALSQSCRRLMDVADDDVLWRPLYHRAFGSLRVGTITSWKDEYKTQYMRKKKEEKERSDREREFAYSPFNPYPAVSMNYPSSQQAVPVPLPGQPLGMFGGGYDLEPQFSYGPFWGAGHGAVLPRPFSQNRPRFPGSRNPTPGSRYDPMNPSGRFRPGRGGGVVDEEQPLMLNNDSQNNASNRRGLAEDLNRF